MLYRPATPRGDKGPDLRAFTPRHCLETVLERLVETGDSGAVPERFVRDGTRTGFETDPERFQNSFRNGSAPSQRKGTHLAGRQGSTAGRQPGGRPVRGARANSTPVRL